MRSPQHALVGLLVAAVTTTLTTGLSTGALGAVSGDHHYAADAAVRAPLRPQATARRLDAHRVRLAWKAPAATGRAHVTGYRVTRNGTDARGHRARSTVLPASRHALTLAGLRADARYTFTVAARSRSGWGASARVTLASAVATRTAGPASAVSGAPGTPTITASSVGDHSLTVGWAPPASAGSSPVTGYRVARNGTDLEGKGAWSTVVPATQRSFTMTLLTNGTSYTFSVSALNAAGTGPAASVALVPGTGGGQAPVPSSVRPYVAQSAVGQPVSLRQGSATGPRLKMAGVCVWGVPDSVTAGGSFGLNQYNDRANIVAAAKAWGANHIRLRVLADDYNNDRQGLSKAQRLAMIKGWRDAAVGAGLYFYVTWWDSLDGYAQDGNWPTRYSSAFSMMTDVYRTLGNDPHVFYEPFNEPNSFGDQWNAWGAAMRATVAHWRSIGYTGLLLIDTPVWSHAYDDAAMTALERYDAGLAGMGGRMQLAFAKHDYANEGWPNGGGSFDPSKWRNDTGGAQQRHLVWETEFGNYNGDPSTVHLSWSQQASTFFADEFGDAGRPNYAGATAFVWGAWWDANALTDASNNPTAWGRAVRDGLLLRAGAPRP
jgi:Fibronectin type III domain/Cellulase (glycosyl hydrolase family 5)